MRVHEKNRSEAMERVIRHAKPEFPKPSTVELLRRAETFFNYVFVTVPASKGSQDRMELLDLAIDSTMGDEPRPSADDIVSRATKFGGYILAPIDPATRKD